MVTFKPDLEGQSDLDGQRWDGAFRRKPEMSREGAKEKHRNQEKAK